MIILGIDPGKDGAVALLDTDGPTVIKAFAYQTRKVFIQGKEYDEKAILQFIGHFQPDLIVLERQQAMTKQGVTSTFSTGMGYGMWRMACAYSSAAFGTVHHVVRATQWQKAAYSGVVGDGKQRSFTAAKRLLPALDLQPGACRVDQDGIADAGLIAWYGLQLSLRGAVV